MHREALRHLCQCYCFDRPCVIGSLLSSTNTEDSELDLLVKSRRGATLFTLAGLEQEAQALTGVRVSVLKPGFLSLRFRDDVMRQAEPL
ncbi:MAG: nucleotidyltransferase family protein [bacterium]|jgi:predicted nucleotidyltransferase|nr:nucleotidyltransferase [Betaproteobacteria bacterium]